MIKLEAIEAVAPLADSLEDIDLDSTNTSGMSTPDPLLRRGSKSRRRSSAAGPGGSGRGLAPVHERDSLHGVHHRYPGRSECWSGLEHRLRSGRHSILEVRVLVGRSYGK